MQSFIGILVLCLFFSCSSSDSPPPSIEWYPPSMPQDPPGYIDSKDYIPALRKGWPRVNLLKMGDFISEPDQDEPLSRIAPLPTPTYFLKKKEFFAPPKGKILKFTQINVGSATVMMRPEGTTPECPNYKLCNLSVIKNIREYLLRTQADVIAMQEAQGLSQLFQEKNGGPLFDEQFEKIGLNYAGVCVPGHMRVEEVCLLWNQSKVQVRDPDQSCFGVSYPNNGALKCELYFEGERIQFLSAHPEVRDTESKRNMLDYMWHELLDRERPAVVMGDFNTENCTLGYDCNYPYPAEFGTLYGKHRKNFGRWNPKHTFSGYYEGFHQGQYVGRALGISNHVVGKVYGQIFANFGEPYPFREQGYCLSYSCIAGKSDGYEGFPHPFHAGTSRLIGYPVDHYPVTSRLLW